MFLQMWEPHQTSAYFSAFFIRIYMALFRTTTGIVVYLNTVGVICGFSLFGSDCLSFLHYCIYGGYRRYLSLFKTEVERCFVDDNTLRYFWLWIHKSFRSSFRNSYVF